MKYDIIVSLGSSCCPGLSLRELDLKHKTFPFDWVRSNTKIIYDILINGKDNFLSFNNKYVSDDFYIKDLHLYTHSNFPNSHINYYGQHFTHYIDISTNDLIKKYDNYINRFMRLLSLNKKILFVHSNEEYIYHKKSRDDKLILYNYLCKINDIIIDKYPQLEFEIINIDIDNTFENYKNIINLNMEYDLPFSDYCEHHSSDFYNIYRDNITTILKKYIEENSNII